MSFDGKRFRVVVNEGPSAEVGPDTVFDFRQDDDLVHADYFGGEVRYGKLLGVLDGDTLRHRYVQVNRRGQFSTGQATVAVSRTDDGRLRLTDSWQWEHRDGRGHCIMEEL